MAASKLRRTAPTLGAALLAAFLGWVGYKTVTAGSDVPPPQPNALVQLDRGRASGKRLDGRSWSFDYTRATMTADGEDAELDDVRDGILERNGKPYLHLRAQHVEANLAGNDFTATGPVVLTEIGPLHRRLETVGARFVGVQNVLILDHRTTISQGAITVVVDHATVDFTTGDTRFGRIVGTM